MRSTRVASIIAIASFRDTVWVSPRQLRVFVQDRAVVDVPGLGA